MTTNNVILSVAIPILNEEKNIAIVVRDSCETLDATELKDKYELILIDDGSTDSSPAIVKELQQRLTCVETLFHEKNKGFGAAIKAGFKQARGKYVSFIPSDGEIKMEQVLKFYRKIGDADILVSQRYCPDEESRKLVRPWFREVLTWGNRTLTKFILGVDIRGMEGIFLIKNSVLSKVSLCTNNYVTYEVILYCIKNKCKFEKGIMQVSPRLSGRSKVTNLRIVFKTFFDILKIPCRR